MPTAQKSKLGSHLEWHGATIRVIVRVPPSKVKALGKTKLKEALPTASPREAEVLKWPVIARLKAELNTTKRPPTKDPLLAKAFLWREAIQEAREGEGPTPEEDVDYAFDATAEQIANTEGQDRANLFTTVALGLATPLGSLVEDWLREKDYAPRVLEGHRYAIRQLESWCGTAKVPPSVEAITRRMAGRFIGEQFITRDVSPATANKAIGALRSYWNWMSNRGHIADGTNPWTNQSIADKARDRRKRQREPGESDKRPFTNEEVATLLDGLKDEPLLFDFCRVAALTGMRRDEIATLRVRHLRAGLIKVPGTKTAAAVRDVPVHPLLTDLLARRTAGKEPEAFLFHELPEQTNPARGRGAPVTQAFTRKRRALGVDDTPLGARQSRVDLHSWRRWFIRQALSALERGATGFTAWTIADVVGHSNEEGPLAMTMGRYPGRADTRALRACVEAVRLPA